MRHVTKAATLRTFATLWFLSFYSLYLPENYTCDGRGGSSFYVFDSLGLNPEILRAIAEQGYVEPTLSSSRPFRPFCRAVT